jgi:hypothetical protein
MKYAYTAFTLGLASLVGLVSLVGPGPVQAQGTRSLYTGSSVPAASGARTIVIGPDTRWVNVNQGEEIRFVVGSVEFGWRFDAPGSRSFDLQQVAPAGALNRPVMAYIMSTGGHPAR